MADDTKAADLVIIGGGFAYGSPADEIKDLQAACKQVTSDDFMMTASQCGTAIRPAQGIDDFVDAIKGGNSTAKIGKIFVLTHASGAALGFKGKIKPGMSPGTGVTIDMASAVTRAALERHGAALKLALKDRIDAKSSMHVFACLAGDTSVDMDVLKMLNETLGIDVYGWDKTMVCYTHKPWDDKSIPQTSRGWFEVWYPQLAQNPRNPNVYGYQQIQYLAPTRLASGGQVKTLPTPGNLVDKIAAIKSAEDTFYKDKPSIPALNDWFWDLPWDKALAKNDGLFYASDGSQLHLVVFRAPGSEMEIIQRTTTRETFATTVENACKANPKRTLATQGCFSVDSLMFSGGPNPLSQLNPLMGDVVSHKTHLKESDPRKDRACLQWGGGYSIKIAEKCDDVEAAIGGLGPVLIGGSKTAGDRPFYEGQKPFGPYNGKSFVAISPGQKYMLILVQVHGQPRSATGGKGYEIDDLRDRLATTGIRDCVYLDGGTSVMLYVRGEWKVRQDEGLPPDAKKLKEGRKNDVTSIGLRFTVP